MDGWLFLGPPPPYRAPAQPVPYCLLGSTLGLYKMKKYKSPLPRPIIQRKPLCTVWSHTALDVQAAGERFHGNTFQASTATSFSNTHHIPMGLRAHGLPLGDLSQPSQRMFCEHQDWPGEGEGSVLKLKMCRKPFTVCPLLREPPTYQHIQCSD